MDRFAYRLPQKSLKMDYFFNMLGSMTNAAVSVVLLIVVRYITDESSAGVFSLAFPTAQMMYTIGVFEMRNIQVTDSKRQFAFGSVLMFRILSITVMLAYTVLFITYNGYTGEKAVIIMLLTVYMAVLAFSDVFQGVLHLNGYLYLSGISLAAITFLALIAFAVALFFTKSLILSVIPMIAVALLWVLFYDVPFASTFERIRPQFDLKIQKAIVLCALPVFLSTFLQQYIFNSQKYAIDVFLSDLDQAHYGYLVMPTFVINLLSIFVFRPLLVSLSEKWAKKEYKGFLKTIRRLYGFIIAIIPLALVAAYFFGIPVLEMLYHTDLSGKREMLLILLVAGGFSAGCSLTVILLTLIRKQVFGLSAYVLTAAVSLFLPKMLVSQYQLLGAGISYLAEMAMLFAILLIILIVFVRKQIRTDGESRNA